jgi:hypothetical protein
MWVFDNILRGLFTMLKITLMGYAVIHVFLVIRQWFRNLDS